MIFSLFEAHKLSTINFLNDEFNMRSIKKVIEGAEEQLKGIGRVLVRYSGTETKARVMVESENQELVHSLVDEISGVIEKEIGTAK